MRLAVIPARGGSKRVPRKNIRDFGGAPIISYSIRTALEADVFDQVIVSTDDEEIADIARRYGAETPFLRPDTLSDDRTPTIPVIRHAIEHAEKGSRRLDSVCCIYPTAPFLIASDLSEAAAHIQLDPTLDFVFAATTFAFPIFRAFSLKADGTTAMLWPEYEQARSQDLPEVWHDAGQFYFGRRNAWMTNDRLLGSRSGVVKLQRHRVQDIDTEEDWQRAEAMFFALKEWR